MSTLLLEKTDVDWISLREAARVTCLPLPRVKALGDEGFLTIRRAVVGAPIRYSRQSCEALRDSLVVPASRTVDAS